MERRVGRTRKSYGSTIQLIMENINKICAALDAQGYYLNGEFHIREVSIVSHNMRCSFLCHVDIDKIIMSSKNRKTMKVVEYMTSLPIDPDNDCWTRKENYKICLQKPYQKYYGAETILSMYQWVQTADRPYVAIKNSQIIPILKDFDIPYVHIDNIKDLVTEKYDGLCARTCDYHYDKYERVKCAESKADAIWILITEFKCKNPKM